MGWHYSASKQDAVGWPGFNTICGVLYQEAMMAKFPGKEGHSPETRTMAMPADANPNGDIFGGWVLSQMDIAAGMACGRRAQGRVATVGIEAMTFHLPVFVGDSVSCFTKILGVGRTSITVQVETWAERARSDESVKVTEGKFVMVALDENRRSRPVPPLKKP